MQSSFNFPRGHVTLAFTLGAFTIIRNFASFEGPTTYLLAIKNVSLYSPTSLSFGLKRNSPFI